jgi:polyisoprenoid-binding protein YceI
MTEPATKPSLPAVAAGPWSLDAATSSVTFHHKSVFGLVNVRGTFPVRDGGGLVGADGSASGTLVVDTAGLDSKHGARDKHLKSADFFDVERFPDITFTADEVRRVSPDSTEVRVGGRLTVKSVEKAVSFLAHASTGGDGSVTLTAEVTFDRHDYGLSWNRIGMIKGLATLSVRLRFVQEQ